MIAGAPTGGAFGRIFESFANRNFLLYWIGALSSTTGNWIQVVGQAWLVLALTNSPFALGTVTSLQFVPVLLFSLFGGVVADRMPKRRTLFVIQAVGAVSALALAVLSARGVVELWHVYVFAVVTGVLLAFDGPVRNALVVELVEQDEIPNAVALSSSVFTLSRFLGPAVGGIALANVSFAGCFALNALSYVPALVTLWSIDGRRMRTASRPDRGPILANIRAGLGYAWRTPNVMLPLIVIGMLALVGYQYPVVIPLVARYLLAVGPEGLGFFTSAVGVGSIAATIWMAYRRFSSIRVQLWAATAFTLGWLVIAFSRSYGLSIVAFVALGFAGSTFLQSGQTRIQLNTPDAMRGRVMSIWSLLFTGTTSFGTFGLGALAQRAGVDVLVFAVALSCALGVATAFAYSLRNGLIGRRTRPAG